MDDVSLEATDDIYLAETDGNLRLVLAHTYTGDISASPTIVPYTVEVVDGVQAWEAWGVLAERIDLGFDALAVPGNSMWTISADLKAINNATTTATGSLSVPSTLETMEGHLSQIYEGATGTAFASLSELSASLISYRLSINTPKNFRVYGDDADDFASGWGLGKSSAISDFFDIYNVSGSVPTARRWRVKCTGSSPKTVTIDHRVVFTDVHVNPDGRDGERTVDVSGYAIYDSTLGSDVEIIQTGTNTALP